MRICFYSVDDDENKVSFQTEGRRDNGKIIFPDKSVPDTVIFLTVTGDRLVLERRGRVSMLLPLQEGKINPASYKNEMGLEFSFAAACRKLRIEENRIDIQYDMIFEDEVQSSHKIWIILR